MTCAEVHPNLATFVLGGLEPEEAAEIQRHIASCADCQSELEELRRVNRALDAAPPPAAPPAYLKGEILSRVRAERLSPSNKAGSGGKIIVPGRAEKFSQDLSLQPLQGAPPRSPKRGGSGPGCRDSIGRFLRLFARRNSRSDHPTNTDSPGGRRAQRVLGCGRNPAAALWQPAGGAEAQQLR